MSRVSKVAIHSAMFSSFEGYVSAVVDSVEFESGIKLNDEEQRQVYRLVERVITSATSKRYYQVSKEMNAGFTRILYTVPPVQDNKQTDELVMWVKRLAHSLRNARPDSRLHGAAMDYLSREGLISVETVLR